MKRLISFLLAIILTVVLVLPYTAFTVNAQNFGGAVENKGTTVYWEIKNSILTLQSQGGFPSSGGSGFGWCGTVNGYYVARYFSVVVFCDGIVNIPYDVFISSMEQANCASNHLLVYIPASVKTIEAGALDKCSTVYCFSDDCVIPRLQQNCTLYANENSQAAQYAQTHTDINFVKLCKNHILYDSLTPTCTEYGYEGREKCMICEATLKIGTEIPPLGHDFIRQVAEEKYLCTKANHNQAATYYYSCSRCFAKGSKTFFAGDTVPESELLAGDTIEFGEYPQTKITDEKTIEKLNQASLNSEWKSYQYTFGNGDFNSQQADDYMQYTDMEQDGNKYRGVKLISYRPYQSFGKSTQDRSYQDDNGYTAGNTYWFQYEPVKWIVINPQTGFVISESILDAQIFNTVYLTNNQRYKDTSLAHSSIDYSHSFIREWLNDTFYQTAFTKKDTQYIYETEIENKAYAFGKDATNYDCENSTDRVFLLSAADILNNEYFADSTHLTAVGTDYAKSQNLFVDAENGFSSWYLRSGFNQHVNVIATDTFYLSETDMTQIGIIPAMYIDLAKVPKCNHTYQITNANEPTCSIDGYTEYKCTKCGDGYRDILSARHTLTTYSAKMCTCTEAGWNEYQVCSRCDFTTYTEIPSKGHQWAKAVTVDVQEDDVKHFKLYTCTVCKATKIETIPEQIETIPEQLAAIKSGDVDNNSKIEASDARLTLRAAVGLEVLTTQQMLAADVDKNSKIEAADARIILRASVALEKL